ncbi:EF-hand domain-containing protein [Flavobacterium muglaense]|uniref:EF-hand domain-containing protein n=1 Tax=Flavobacterium muglaense TaxID=2764716 RepID=UPI001C9B9C6C|nr:EF-hand domain-containing protein [Flavobacterium muglaense]
MKKECLLILTAILLLSCKSNQLQNRHAEAVDEHPSAQQIIAQFDANKDGKLSITEVDGPLTDDFTKIDANSDGFLTLDELNEAPHNHEGGPPNEPIKNQDLSNEINSSVKVVPVNTNYFITENIIGGI